MKNIIYADNAATTKLDHEALEAMSPFFMEEYGNASQPYSFSRGVKKAIKQARKTIADCINAEPDEIYFTACGSESDNWAIQGIAFNDMNGEIITSEIEHHAILKTCAEIANYGIKVSYMKPDKNGVILPEVLNEAITSKTRLVSIMFVNNEIGSIQPIKELCSIAHKRGALFHTDAVQAVGHIRIDVKDLGVDLLSASAHKFNGPKGVGFLYIKRGTHIKSLIYGGSQEFGYRAGTENVAGIIGMATALKNNCDSIDDNNAHLRVLENKLLDGLSGIRFIRNGAKEHAFGIMSLSFPNQDGESILHRLDLKGIIVSTGAACDSVNTKISHVLKAIRLDEKYAKGTIRISLGKNNTEEDANKIASELKEILTQLY